jgi:hypothetical protein
MITVIALIACLLIDPTHCMVAATFDDFATCNESKAIAEKSIQNTAPKADKDKVALACIKYKPHH